MTSPLTASSSDESLEALLRTRPPEVVLARVRQEAVQAYEQIRASGGSSLLGIEDFWLQANWAIRDAAPRQNTWPMPLPIQQLRIVLDTRDMLVGIAADMRMLSAPDRMTLLYPERLVQLGNQMLQRAVRDIMARYPGLAALLARQDARLKQNTHLAAEGQERLRQAVERQRAEARALSARALFTRLAVAGVTLRVAKGGGIAVTPVALLTADARAEIRELREELTELLSTQEEVVA